MRAFFLIIALAVAWAAWNPKYNDAPIWKVFCDSRPVFQGRADSIVNPGTYSGHVHKVFGGNHFSASTTSRTPAQSFSVTKSASCTTCSIKTVDNTNYWTSDLYYRWSNGTYSLVPTSGLTVYYLSRGGYTGANKTNPNWQPIPKGLRMIAGDPSRRTFNQSSMADQAISYVCLNYNGGAFPESNDWSGLAKYSCKDGLRAQVFFPMCWDGKNLDSPDHRSHMSYPVNGYNAGDCPNSHPVRLPAVFFEHLYSLKGFPSGTGSNNFLWSMGDTTGYGFHGDFLSGWDPQVMAAAIAHPNCSNNNPLMAFGNAVKACPPLAPYVKDNTEPPCFIKNPIPLTENLGVTNPIRRMPGCWTATGAAPGCDPTPAGSDSTGAFHIFSPAANAYVTADRSTRVLSATVAASALTTNEIWGFGQVGQGQVFIQNAELPWVVSAQSQAILVGNSPSLWEYWSITPQDSKNITVAFRSSRTSKFLSLQADKTFQFNAATVTSTETFKLVAPTGGSVPSDDGFSSYQNMAVPDLKTPIRKIKIN